MQANEFLGGVVEGFYGRPWTEPQRLQLFKQMADWGLNAYFYAPKDDLKHRATWRECYEPAELASLKTLIEACAQRNLSFIYGLSPGLDIRFADPSELELIRQRLSQLISIGCRHFCLLFDDLPGQLHADDRAAFPSVAAAQCFVTNEIFQWLREHDLQSQLLFCPTVYCDRMDRWQLGGAGYLDTVGGQLDRSINVLWTGPEIVSGEIDVVSVQRLADRIGRRPVIWDNLFANDYDQCRLYCGPYSGRAPELRQHVAGILVNPNNEFPVNYIPLRTLAAYLRCDHGWNPRAAFMSAAHEWLDRYRSVGQPIDVEDLILLADCYYLPHEEGPEAGKLLRLVADLVHQPAESWGNRYEEFISQNGRIQSLADRLTELRDRELFYAWSRRVWDLKEEFLLLEELLKWKKSAKDAGPDFLSQTHLPGTYRGGFVAKVRKLSAPGLS